MSTTAPHMLSIQNLNVHYGQIRAVQDINLEIRAGEIVTLIGANGAGKTSVLRAISGLANWTGSIQFVGRDLQRVPAHAIAAAGIGHVPEGRGIFGNLTVMENLKLAAWNRRDKKALGQDLERVHHLFPRLAERRHQSGNTLSGGEQQMLAIARAIIGRARLLLLDEPSMGLSPILVREIFTTIRDINAGGATILLVEQNARMALHIAARGYVLETGRIVLTGSGQELLANPEIRTAYLGEQKSQKS